MKMNKEGLEGKYSPRDFEESLYKNNEDFRKKVDEIWGKIKDKISVLTK
jgi:hypothetical protein